MKSHYYIIIIFVFLLGSCSSWRNMIIVKGNENDAVQNAITDFLHSGKLSKKDTVFGITIKNINGTVLGVNVFGNTNKLLPNSKNKIGTNHPGFPTRYFEQQGKLFYWYDPAHNITSDLISILSKYKRIDSLNVNGFVGIPDAKVDDSKKGVDYYFCKCNLRKYKKVYTSIAMGGYELPKLECGCVSTKTTH